MLTYFQDENKEEGENLPPKTTFTTVTQVKQQMNETTKQQTTEMTNEQNNETTNKRNNKTTNDKQPKQ